MLLPGEPPRTRSAPESRQEQQQQQLTTTPPATPQAADDTHFFDSLHRVLLSHIRRGNHAAVMLVVSLPHVYGSDLFWRTCTYPAGLVGAAIAASCITSMGDAKGSEEGAPSALSLALEDAEGPGNGGAENRTGTATADSPSRPSPSSLTLPELYLLLQWCLQQRRFLQRLRAERATVSEGSDPPNTQPRHLLPPTAQTQPPHETAAAVEEEGEEDRDSDETCEDIDTDPTEDDEDAFAVFERTPKRRPRGGVRKAPGRKADHRRRVAEAADDAVDVALLQLLSQTEEPRKDEVAAAGGAGAQAAATEATVLSGEGKKEEDSIDLIRLSALLCSQCQFFDYENPLAGRVPAAATPEPTVAAVAEPTPFTAPPTQDLIAAPPTHTHDNVGSKPWGQRSPSKESPTPAPTPSSSSSSAVSSIPLAQRLNDSSASAVSASVHASQPTQVCPRSASLSFRPKRSGEERREGEGNGDGSVNSTASATVLGDASGHRRKRSRPMEEPRTLPQPVKPVSAADAIEAFDAFNSAQEQQRRPSHPLGSSGGVDSSSTPRRLRFTAEEDEAIIRGVSLYGQRNGAFKTIYHAFRGVWRPNRTPTHLYDHWRGALKAKALQRLTQELGITEVGAQAADRVMPSLPRTRE